MRCAVRLVLLLCVAGAVGTVVGAKSTKRHAPIEGVVMERALEVALEAATASVQAAMQNEALAPAGTSVTAPDPAGGAGDGLGTLIEITDVYAGFDMNGVPCLNCVTGASGIALGTPFPRATIEPGRPIKWVMTYASRTYAGPVFATIVVVRLSDNRVGFSRTSQVLAAPGAVGVYSLSALGPTLSGDSVVFGLLSDFSGLPQDFRYSLLTITP